MIENEIIKKILELAIFAPTPDNTQPWRFKIIDSELHIFHIPEKSEHSLNPKFITSCLTFGCLIECIDLASQKYGFKAKAELVFKNIEDLQNNHWAKIHFTSIDSKCDYSEAIKNRTTDRRQFGGGDLEELGIEKFVNEKFDNKNLKFNCVNLPKSEVLKSITASETYLMDHPRILREVLHWVRFNDKEKLTTRDGMPWKNMLIKIWELPSIKLVKKYPALFKALRPILKKDHAKRTLKQLESSAGVYFVSCDKNEVSLHDIVDCGKMMFHAWIKLTQQGWAAQPLSLSSLPTLYKIFGCQDEFFKNVDADLKSTQDKILSAANLKSDSRIVWMMRTGINTPLPSDFRTLRRENYLEE